MVNTDIPPFKAGIAPVLSSNTGGGGGGRNGVNLRIGGHGSRSNAQHQLYKGIALKRGGGVKGASKTTTTTTASSSSLDPTISRPPIDGVLNTKQLTRKLAAPQQPHPLSATVAQLLLASTMMATDNAPTTTPAVAASVPLPYDDKSMLMMSMLQQSAFDRINSDDHSSKSTDSSKLSSNTAATGQHSTGYFSASSGSYMSNSPMALLSVPSVTIMKSASTYNSKQQYVQQQQQYIQQQQGYSRNR